MKKCISVLAFFLIVIGALNWGLWGFFQFDFVAWLCKGNTTWLARLIYAVIGLAGVWSLGMIPCCCKHVCGSGVCPKCGKTNCSCKKGGGCCKM